MKLALIDLRQSYILEHNVSSGYEKQLGYAIKCFEEHLGRTPVVSDLDPDTVNRWLKAEEAAGKISLRTIKNYRGSILTLWKFAYEERQIEVAPNRVRKIKVPRKSPVAWTAEQIRRLLEVADELTGRYQRSRVPRAAFWRALILCIWDTGLRRGDVRSLTTFELRGRDTFTVTQHKTGIPIVCRLRQETIDAIEATYPPERPLVFGGVLSTVKLSMTLKSLAEKAGLPTHDGATRMLRRSAATALEIVMPGAAMRFLGHATPGLAHRHYIDPVILGATGAAPPSLLSAGLDGAIVPATEVPSLGSIQELLERAIVSAKRKELVISLPPSDVRSFPPNEAQDIAPLLEKFLSRYPSDRKRVFFRSIIRMPLEESGVWTVAELSRFQPFEYFAAKHNSGQLTRMSAARRLSSCMMFLRWLTANDTGASEAAIACLGRADIARWRKVGAA